MIGKLCHPFLTTGILETQETVKAPEKPERMTLRLEVKAHLTLLIGRVLPSCT